MRKLLPVITAAVVAVALSAASLIGPQMAAADILTASASAKLSHNMIGPGSPALARVNVHQRFSSVDSVCFYFTFVNDLIDPGENLSITPLQLYPSLSGFGFINIGLTPEAERALCVVGNYPDVLALFLDGKDKDLEIGMPIGSAEISSLSITVTGTPA